MAPNRNATRRTWNARRQSRREPPTGNKLRDAPRFLLFLEKVADPFGGFVEGIGGGLRGVLDGVGGTLAEIRDTFLDGFQGGDGDFVEDLLGELGSGDALGAGAEVGEVDVGDLIRKSST